MNIAEAIVVGVLLAVLVVLAVFGGADYRDVVTGGIGALVAVVVQLIAKVLQRPPSPP